MSVEIELAKALGLKLGDELTYDVAGETVDAQRDELPRGAVGLVPAELLHGVLARHARRQHRHVHHERAHRAASSAACWWSSSRQFPEVTAIDLDAILTQVRGVMDKASLAVQYVFAFTLLAGITVLLAAIQATRDERRYESAMLRTLGASRRVVLQGVAAEFTTLGMLAGTLAAIGATAAGYFLATRVFDLEYTFSFAVWGVGLVAGALLVGVSGTLATRSVVNHPPVATLRTVDRA